MRIGALLDFFGGSHEVLYPDRNLATRRPAWSAPSDDAFAANARGNYATALEIIKPMAAIDVVIATPYFLVKAFV